MQREPGEKDDELKDSGSSRAFAESATAEPS